MKFSLRSDKPRASTVKDDARRTVAATELEPNEATRVGVYVFALVMFALGFAVIFAATVSYTHLFANRTLRALHPFTAL